MNAYRAAVAWMRNTFSQDEILVIAHASAFAFLAWLLGFAMVLL